MKAWAKQFALVFFTGFIALGAALGYGSISGDLVSDHPFLVALRFFGVGFMAAGFVLWIALRREEAGKPGLNPFFGLTLVGGCILLVLGGVFPSGNLGPLFGWGGVGLNLAALVIGLIVTLFAPAYPQPVTKRWPEGGEAEISVHNTHDSHEAGEHPAEPQDLTQIEGVGPKAQELLKRAGIITYADIARRSSEELTNILKSAGFRAPFNASTWPQQAELAAKGDWEALRALQDKLVGGRNK